MKATKIDKNPDEADSYLISDLEDMLGFITNKFVSMKITFDRTRTNLSFLTWSTLQLESNQFVGLPDTLRPKVLR